MFREADAFTADRNLVDKAVNPGRLAAFADDHRRGAGSVEKGILSGVGRGENTADLAEMDRSVAGFFIRDEMFPSSVLTLVHTEIADFPREMEKGNYSQIGRAHV